MGLILVSIRRFVGLICYQGGVFGFLNQSEINISANFTKRVRGGLARFTQGLLSPVAVVA